MAPVLILGQDWGGETKKRSPPHLLCFAAQTVAIMAMPLQPSAESETSLCRNKWEVIWQRAQAAGMPEGLPQAPARWMRLAWGHWVQRVRYLPMPRMTRSAAGGLEVQKSPAHLVSNCLLSTPSLTLPTASIHQELLPTFAAPAFICHYLPKPSGIGAFCTGSWECSEGEVSECTGWVSSSILRVMATALLIIWGCWIGSIQE